MPKIVFIGAGGHVFSKATISDTLSYPELRDCTITLVDTAQEPLDLIASFAKTLVNKMDLALKSSQLQNVERPWMERTMFLSPLRSVAGPARSPMSKFR